jgi:membrane protein
LRALTVARRVLASLWDDGFIHAGNLAYLSLLTLFPFFIVVAVIAGSLGRSEAGFTAVATFLQTLPPDIAKMLAGPIDDVLSKRADGGLLTLGILVGLWSTASFIETMRDILRRAYNVQFGRPFWHYRLGSMALVAGSVLIMLVAFALQFLLTGVEQFIFTVLPFADDALRFVGVTRIAPVIALFGALYLLFRTLTPHQFRVAGCPKWPGALFTTVIWVWTTSLLPATLGLLGGYELTYGALAGVIVALLFFFIVGLAFVVGAHLNAALAETARTGQKDADVTA